MADIKSVFNVLDDGTEGQALTKKSSGEASTGNGALSFSFRDSSGNVILPQLTASGALPVDTGAVSGTVVSDHSIVASVADTETAVAVASLVSSTAYTCAEFSVSCAEQTTWKLYNIDDAGGTPVKTLIWSGITGAGSLTICCQPKNLTFTSGSTGTQTLSMEGTCKKSATDMHAFISALG